MEVKARLQTVDKALTLFYLAWNVESPVGTVQAAQINLWAKALKDIPVAQILPLAEEEIREGSFFPKPADIIKRYKQRHGLTPEGAPNGTAYLPYHRQERPALPAAQVALRIKPEELKARLGVSARKANPNDDGNEAPTLNERWSGFLVDVARAGNIDLDACTPQQIAGLRAFGRWWLATRPTHDLKANNFGTAYCTFCQERQKEENP